jgi:outer membrane cobalamin receptor
MFKSLTFSFVIILAFLGKISAQTGEMPVKHIEGVTIIKSNRDFFSDDNPTFSLDPPLKIDRQQNLGYMLERESGVLIRSYGGTGSLVSVSLHGTGSNHTQVSWNGFPLNSPTTGQADLSLIPSGFMQTVEIINGASGALYGSGTFGGSINMSNEPDWNNRLTAEYSFDAGSFGAFGNSLFLKTGKRRIQYHISAISGRVENDFPYRDYYRHNSPRERAEHNAFRNRGIIQNVYLNLGKGNYLEAGIWNQYKTKEMPPLMGSYHDNNAFQKDSLFRSYLCYRKISEKSALVIRSGYFSDYLHYTDKLNKEDSSLTVNSEIASRRLMNEADYRYYISSSVIVGGGASYNISTGTSVNYPGEIREHEYAFFGNLKIKWNDWILNTGLRKEFYDQINPPLQYSFGIRYKAGRNLALRTGLSSKFRKPTFNEKYWIPGGNPELNPEKGWGGEISSEWTMADKPDRGLHIEMLTNIYFQHVDNWIQWVMQDSLMPVEYKKVLASGIESHVIYSFGAGVLRFKGVISYSYSRSVIVDTYDHNPLYKGRQLMYIPRHSGNASIKAFYKGMILGAGTVFTGSRETVETEDPSLALDPYAFIDLIAGINRRIHGINLGLYCRVDNLFDNQFEVIRSYPMPGRSFHFTLTLGLEKSDPEQ